MSTMNSGGDDQQPDRPGPSEDDAREVLERLRSAPAEEIIADLMSTLLSTAQVKLGRRDARLFIDLCAATLEYAGGYVSDNLRRQAESALGQLRMGQVSAENEVAAKGEPEPNDLSRTPTPPATGTRTRPTPVDQSEPPPSRLWVPGR